MMKILDKKLSNLTIQANNVLKVGNLITTSSERAYFYQEIVQSKRVEKELRCWIQFLE
jgi:hypothetical protein